MLHSHDFIYQTYFMIIKYKNYPFYKRTWDKEYLLLHKGKKKVNIKENYVYV